MERITRITCGKKDQTHLCYILKELNNKIILYEREKTSLFSKGKLSPEEIQLKTTMDILYSSEETLKKLNIEFEDDDDDLVSNIYLIFLKNIIKKTNEKINNKNTTKSEFDSAINILKSTLNGKYSGVIIESDTAKLLQKDYKLEDQVLDNPDKLNFGSGSGIKVFALSELSEYENSSLHIENKFSKLSSSYKKAQDNLIGSRNKLKQIGETEANKILKEKIDKFLGIDEKVKRVRDIIETSEIELQKIIEEIDRITKKYDVTIEGQKEIIEINDKIKQIDSMIELTSKSKKEFLTKLLKNVNEEATTFFRGVRREDDLRLNTIVVDSDYTLHVKNDKGETINPKAINKGNTQIALMAFFYGLSKFLENDLPYIIDDPLIRLDSGHDRRLIQHLSKNNKQIIMHMIPGKEYTNDSYPWLKPYINTQNWINRRKDNNISNEHLISRVEEKDPDMYVKFDINKL